MKIHILYEFKDGPYGGANQFLKALREEFRKTDVYSESVESADIILFNSHHNTTRIFKLKRKYKNKIFIHRVDGPIYLIRNKNKEIDKLIYITNTLLADGTVYQSNWSKEKNLLLGMKGNQFETIITNAPNSLFFNTMKKSQFSTERKLRLIATSWSSNLSKGFDVYQWLDENLDFDKYGMTFCGNSSIKFKNIKHIPPLSSRELSEELKKHDVFITASKNDPCSNSLIEALHCGLPAIVRKDGGHPEIVKTGGDVFEKCDEIPKILTSISQNYTEYQKEINVPKLLEVSGHYLDFFREIHKSFLENNYQTKKIHLFDRIKFNIHLMNIKVIKLKRQLIRRAI